MNVNCNQKPSIIIIGAGSAGIAAASRLIKNNFSNIIILEAENRIGGRIHSIEYGEGIIELGAETCHGENKNVVYELAKDLDLLDGTEIEETIYHSSGKPIDENFVEELFELFYNIYYGDKPPSDNNINLGDYLITEFNQQVTKKYKNDTRKLDIAEEFLFFAEKYVISNEGTFTWFDLSANNEFEETEGNQEISWKGVGYKTFLEILMQNFPDPSKSLNVEEKIILNKEVVQINWNGSLNTDQVAVLCSDDSSYTADYVIVTTSLGVLKNNYKTLFNPTLPLRKVNAIEELGIQAVTKIFLHFPEKWWPEFKELHVNFIWSREDRLKVLEEFPFGPQKNNESWLIDVAGIYTVPQNPNVLQAWCVGSFIPDIEFIPDDIITNGIMFIIKKFMNRDYPNITTPDSIKRYNWYSNPHFQGSYSFETVKSRERNENGHAILSEPLESNITGKPTLLFAGEATSVIHYATVNGAVETGFREADRIISLYISENNNS